MAYRSLIIPFVVICCCISVGRVDAQPKITSQIDSNDKIHFEVGETRLIRLSEKIVRVSIADPKVADVRVVTPLQVLLTAKDVGFTHLILWSEADKPLVVAITCRRNLNDLRRQLKELFPNEQIKVSSTGDLVVLSGTVSDVRIPSRLAQVAQLHSKKLANLVEVSGNQQVQLEVRFAEISRTGVRKMGVNFLWRGSNNVGGMTAADSQTGQYYGQIPNTGASPGPPLIAGSPMGAAFDLFFSTGIADFPFSAILSILAQEGLAKILAEPTLVAMSGHEASFHAGGEIPILIAQQLGNVGVEYKKFGVRLKFQPTVMGNKTISLKVFAEVSEPDPTIGVTLSGYQVPGFKTRNSETTVRLKDGQSFAVAGLLSDTTRSVVKKVPLLGEIPILGSLFRSTSFQREETELLVVVKAHLTKPINMDKLPPMPGENKLTDPSDFQLFMMGSIGPWDKEKKKRKRRRRKKRAEQDESGLRAEAPGAGGPMGPIGFMRD